MHYFTNSGKNYFPSSGVSIISDLPVATYQIMYSMERGFYLEMIDDITAGVPKFYGDVLKRRDRILNTFEDRRQNTGVMLTGSKGSGKSLLARATCEEALKKGYPVVVANAPYSGDSYNALLSSIGKPFVLLLDEFEKVYHDQNIQNQMLSVFDGVFSNKILFLVTCNEKHKLVNFFHNRPGRFFYMWTYGKLDPEFIREYAFENLKNKAHAEGLVALSYLYYDFNFDIVKAFVEDMNRYDESAKDTSMNLNAEPDSSNNSWELAGYKVLNPTFFSVSGKKDLTGTPSDIHVDVLEELTYGSDDGFTTILGGSQRPGGANPGKPKPNAPAKKGFWMPHQVTMVGSPFQGCRVIFQDEKRNYSVETTFGPKDMVSFKYGEGIMKNADIEFKFKKAYSTTYDYRNLLAEWD